jgi:hypothetical protein
MATHVSEGSAEDELFLQSPIIVDPLREHGEEGDSILAPDVRCPSDGHALRT